MKRYVVRFKVYHYQDILSGVHTYNQEFDEYKDAKAHEEFLRDLLKTKSEDPANTSANDWLDEHNFEPGFLTEVVGTFEQSEKRI